MVKWHMKQALLKIPVNGSEKYTKYLLPLPWFVLEHEVLSSVAFGSLLQMSTQWEKVLVLLWKWFELLGPHRGLQTGVLLTTLRTAALTKCFLWPDFEVLTCLRSTRSPTSLNGCTLMILDEERELRAAVTRGPPLPLGCLLCCGSLVRWTSALLRRAARSNLCHNTSHCTVRIGLCRRLSNFYPSDWREGFRMARNYSQLVLFLVTNAQ